MSHKSNSKMPFDQRAAVPLVSKDAKGNPILMCPFCKPSHQLILGSSSACGSELQIRAVQTVYHAKYNGGMICAKCGKSKGNMVRFQNAFVHIDDCSPGVVAMTEPPKYSKLAGLVFKLPPKPRALFEKYMGKARPVDEVLPDGKRTGVTLGYFFYKGVQP